MEGRPSHHAGAGPDDMELSPTLSLIKKAVPTLMGRKVAVLVTDGSDDALLATLKKAVEKEGAQLAIIAPKIGGVTTTEGVKLPADQALGRALGAVRCRGGAAVGSGAALLARKPGRSTGCAMPSAI